MLFVLGRFVQFILRVDEYFYVCDRRASIVLAIVSKSEIRKPQLFSEGFCKVSRLLCDMSVGALDDYVFYRPLYMPIDETLGGASIERQDLAQRQESKEADSTTRRRARVILKVKGYT
jgi:hypothetical protein